MKKFEDIRVTVLKEYPEYEERSSASLEEAAAECLVKLGKTDYRTAQFLLSLLTAGKVRLSFKDYNVRLSLNDPGDKVTRALALQALEEYLARVGDMSVDTDRTQRIVIQKDK